MTKNLPHLAARAFGTPLLFEPKKAETILGVLVKKLEDGTIEIAESRGDKKEKRYTVTSDGLAIIPVNGSLVNRGLTFGPMSGMTSYEYIRNSIEDALGDSDINTIVLDIDSPGGEADGAFDISDFIYNSRGIKPIVAVVDGMAASAAYAIASAADRIISTRTAITGSVGVIAAHRDVSAKNEKDGIKYTIVRAGKRKALLNEVEPLAEEALTKLQAEIDDIYTLFVDTVARNRNMSTETIRKTEADTYMGAAALELGFVDEISDRKSALKGLLSSSLGDKMVASATNVKSQPQKEKTMSNKDNDSQAEAKVVDLDSARSAGRAEATEIVQLCQLAGKPQIAATYLAEGKSADEVRTLLLAEQVSENHVEVSSTTADITMNEYSDPASNPLLKAAEAKAASMKANSRTLN